MEIEIDTKEDSTEDIKRAIRLLQDVVSNREGKSSSSIPSFSQGPATVIDTKDMQTVVVGQQQKQTDDDSAAREISAGQEGTAHKLVEDALPDETDILGNPMTHKDKKGPNVIVY